MSPRHIFIPALFAAALSACSILPAPEPLDLYMLPGGFPPAEQSADAGPTLRVLRPSSGAQLAGRAITVIPDDQRVSVYKNAAWTDPAPQLLRDRIVDALRADSRIGAVSSDERSLQAEIELDSDLRAFQSEYRNGQPEAVIRIDARLVSSTSRQILASRRFETRQPSAATTVPAVVNSFGTAADRIAQEIAQWVALHGLDDQAR